jgi:hypothetical protein
MGSFRVIAVAVRARQSRPHDGPQFGDLLIGAPPGAGYGPGRSGFDGCPDGERVTLGSGVAGLFGVFVVSPGNG